MEDELYRLTARIFCATSTAWTIAAIPLSRRERIEGEGPYSARVFSRAIKDSVSAPALSFTLKRTIFDGTKLPIDDNPPKTTTYSMKLLSSPDLDDSESRQLVNWAT